MLGKSMLAELKALARNHGLATGSQTVPNSVVETAIVQGRSPPKEPTQRKKMVLKRPKRKAPQVIREEEEEDDEATEDGLISKRKRVAPSSPPAPPPLPTSAPPSTPAPPPSSPTPQAPSSPVQLRFHWPLRHRQLRPKSQISWRTPQAPLRHMCQPEGAPLQTLQLQKMLQSGMRLLIPLLF